MFHGISRAMPRIRTAVHSGTGRNDDRTAKTMAITMSIWRGVWIILLVVGWLVSGVGVAPGLIEVFRLVGERKVSARIGEENESIVILLS